MVLWELFGLLVLLMLSLDAGHQRGCEQGDLEGAAFRGIWFGLSQGILHLGPLSQIFWFGALSTP